VGTINQRKGIKYLLDAVEMLHSPLVELVVCGRIVDDLPAFRNFNGRLEVWPSVSAKRLVEAYQTSDVFVFPSLAEGFGHVLLEAMASGLPVVSTDRTAARELVREGVDGFLVPPGSAGELASRLELFVRDRTLAAKMGAAARLRAEEFTWPRFRAAIGEIVGGILNRAQAKACASHV
jgi:glycosyltransferase involved in cell wall biosynthesis